MDTGSLVVILALVVVIFGISLIRRGSRGAEQEQPDTSEADSDVDEPDS